MSEELIDIESDFVPILKKNYLMCKYEVTQELYQNVMGENPSKFKGKRKYKEKRRPVERVSWYDAIVFCNRLSKLNCKTPVYTVNGETDTDKWDYRINIIDADEKKDIKGEVVQDLSADGYRLPTKDEWQYAARGGEYYTYAGSEDIDEVAWYRDNSDETTHDVGQKMSNDYGLHDMSGNVWEWCWDWDGAMIYRCLCGGSWDDDAKDCKVDGWRWNSADYRGSYIGFRLVCKA